MKKNGNHLSDFFGGGELPPLPKQVEDAPDANLFPVPKAPRKSQVQFWPRRNQMDRVHAESVRRVGRQLLRIAPQLDEERFGPLLVLLAMKYERWQRMVGKLGGDLMGAGGEFRKGVDTLNRVEYGLLQLLSEVGLTPTSAATMQREKRITTIDLNALRQEIEDVAPEKDSTK